MRERSGLERLAWSAYTRSVRMGKRVVSDVDGLERELLLGSPRSKYLLDGQYQSYAVAKPLAQQLSRRLSLIHKGGMKPPPFLQGAIALHVRMTDYLVPSVASTLGVLPEVYYHAALDSLASNARTVLLFSDDEQAARRRLGRATDGLNVLDASAFASGALDSLLLFASCRTKILSNSCFSWWAGYLGEGGEETIAPSPLTLESRSEAASGPGWRLLSTEYDSALPR